jgi:hypothetical protein
MFKPLAGYHLEREPRQALSWTGGLGLVTGGLVVQRKVWVRDAAFTMAPTFGIASGPRFGLVGSF